MNFDDLYDVMKQTVGKATDKLGQVADVASLQFKLKGLERRLEESYVLLGKISYRHHLKPSDQTAADLADAIALVADCRKKVKIMKELIRRQKEANAAQNQDVEVDD